MSWINSSTTDQKVYPKKISQDTLSFYHGFSKTPVEPNTSTGVAQTSLANASTKAGHTVIGTEVWAEEIPWFGLVASRAAAVERLSGLTKLNDLVKVDGEGGKVYKYIGADDAVFTEAQWSSFWQEVTLTNGMTLNNRHNQPVLRYYLNQPMQTLTTTNNASIDSKGFATRLFVDESTHLGKTSGGSVVSQFAAGTDNIKNGIPSVELNPKLYLGTTEKIAGTHYYDYNVSGTVLWSTAVTSSSPKISCFRYIGKTVTSQLTTIDSAVTTHSNEISEIKDKLGLGGTDTPGTPTLGGRVTDNEAALRVLLGLEANAKVVATESISTTATTVATNVITTDLATNGNIAQAIATAKQGAIDSANGYTDGEISTAKASIKEVTDALAGRIAALEGVKLSVQVVDALPDTPVINTIYLVPEEGSTTGTYVEYIAYKPEGSETVTTERIGTTAVDLSGYTTDAEHSALADRVTALDTATTGRVAVVEGKVKTLEETTVPALDTRLSTAEGNITTLQGQVDALTTGDTSVDSKIAAAKTELSNKSLASTSTGSTLVTVTTAGTVGTGMTTTVDTAALATAIDTAKSGAIAAAKTETETQVGELDTKLSGQISALGQIIESNKTEIDETTDALAADVETLKQAMGETEDGTSIIDAITDIKSTLATTTATANSAAQSAEGDTYVSASQSGTKITVSTNISAIDNKLAQEASVVGAAIKAAKQAGDAASQALETAKTQTLAQTGTLANMFTVQTAGTVGTGITSITITDTGLSQAISDAQTAATTAGQNAANAVKTELSAKSLAKTGTLTGMFSVETTGTVGTGLESITITDAGLSQAISNAKSGAITETLASTITTAVGKDNQTTPKVTVTLSGTVQTPVLEVVTNDIASAQELAQLKQSVTDKNVTTTSAAQAVGVTATGNSIDVATASYAPATADASGTWSNEAKLVTGTDVKEAIADINSKIDTLHGSAVTYKVFATLPTAAAEFKGVVALVPANTGDSAVAGSYVQYLCVETVSGDNKTYAWQRIGTTAADFTQYAKSVTINGSKVSTATATGDINLGTVITGIENTSGTENSAILQGSITDGKLTLGIASASTDGKGAVQLASTHDASDTAKAATGSTVAAAISGIAEANASDNGVKVTTAGGSVTGVEVTTTSIVSEGALVESVTGDNLITAADALAAVKLAAPANYITSINGSTGAKAFTIKDGRETVYENDLWGTSVTIDGETITVQGGPIDGSAWGPKNGHNTLSSVWIDGTSYPKGSKPITKVENNMVYNGTTEVANIKTNELVNGYNMFHNTSLTSFSGDLSSLVNGYNMFHNISSLTSFSGDLSSLVNGSFMFSYTSLTSFSGDLSSLVNGSWMFSYTSLTSFSGDLSSLVNGSYMFYSNTSLESFSGDLSSLVNGAGMFADTSLTSFSGDLSSLVYGAGMFGNTSLESFNGDLSSLVDGSNMFLNTSLTSFNGDLSSLVNGSDMFYDTSLESFNGDLSSLVNGSNMFYRTSLASFNGDLSSLVDGTAMFYYTSLESFNGDLSSLVNGSDMFWNTSLDVESVELICDVLPNYNTENGGKQLQTATWNTSGENKGKYTYSDWTSGNYNYPIIKISNNLDLMSQGNADDIDRSFGTESIGGFNIKSIVITWKDISVLSEADRTAITKLFTDTATEKGWTFMTNAQLGGNVSPNAVMATDGTIQYYVFAKKDEATEDNATHIDASGKLWKFDTAEAIIGPNIKYWSMFATVEDALTEWELTPWTKPQEEA